MYICCNKQIKNDHRQKLQAFFFYFFCFIVHRRNKSPQKYLVHEPKIRSENIVTVCSRGGGKHVTAYQDQGFRVKCSADMQVPRAIRAGKRTVYNNITVVTIINYKLYTVAYSKIKIIHKIQIY